MSVPANTGRKIIFDTDFWTDVDDVLDSRLMAWGHRTRRINWIGTLIDVTNNYCFWALDGFQKKEAGAFNIPLGVPLTSHIPTGGPTYQFDMLDKLETYGGLVDRTKIYPNAVTVLRQLLVANAEVEIISTGYLVNISEFLDSGPDEISPLTGIELAAAKCPILWLGNGWFPDGANNNFTRTPQALAAGVNILAKWPSRIIWAGHEIGTDVITGDNLQGMGTRDIVADALLDYGTPQGRPAWGQMAVLPCIAGDPTRAGLTEVRGTVHLDPVTGVTTMTEHADGMHTRLDRVWSAAQFKTIINTLMLPSNWNTYDPFEQAP